ncbi:MAG: OB-fold nucleic acid binding domain-containing protein, partial [Desulfohalobiaceae bacterium]
MNQKTGQPQSQSQVMQQRWEKARQLEDLGCDLFPNDFRPDTCIQDILQAYQECQDAELQELEQEFCIAGRVMALRSFGKVTFLHLQDQSGKLQVFVQKNTLGQEAYNLFKKFDIGDILGVRGTLFRTKTSELTLNALEVRLLSKSLRPLPEKYLGLKDVEARYRQRYVDLIVTHR